MTRRHSYDAATPYYGEPQPYEKEIAALKARAKRAEEAAGDFQELERINAELIRDREAAEAKVAKLREALTETLAVAARNEEGRFAERARAVLQETEQ